MNSDATEHVGSGIERAAAEKTTLEAKTGESDDDQTAREFLEKRVERESV